MSEFTSLMIPLLLTIIIEYLVIQVFVEDRNVIKEVIVVNVLTNPAINLFFRYLCDSYEYFEKIILIISLIEIIIVFVEALVYTKLLKLNFSKMLLYSFLANLLAYLGSFVI